MLLLSFAGSSPRRLTRRGKQPVHPISGHETRLWPQPEADFLGRAWSCTEDKKAGYGQETVKKKHHVASRGLRGGIARPVAGPMPGREGRKPGSGQTMRE